MSVRSSILSRLSGYGLSSEGRDFVMKALNPAEAGVSPGIPDSSACPVLRPEYTVQYSIPTPVVSTSTWDCLILIPPGDVNAVIYAYGPSGTDFSASTVPPGGGIGTVPLQPSIDVAGSTTWNTFVPIGLTNLSLRVPNSGALAFRHTYKSVTAELIAAAVNDQGDVYAAQYSPDQFSQCSQALLATSTVTGNQLVVGRTCVRVPFTEADLTLSSRAPYVGKAKDGVYMPLHLTGPTQAYATGAPVASGYSSTGSIFPYQPGSVQLPQAMYFSNVDTGDYTNFPFINNWTVEGFPQYDTGYDNTAIGVVIFRGIAASSGGGFGSTIMLKICDGQEVCPKPTQFNRVFLKDPMRYEPLALQAYYAVMCSVGHAYPAKYNLFGLLGPMILRAMSILGPMVAPYIPGFLKKGKAYVRGLLADDEEGDAPVKSKKSEALLRPGSGKPTKTVSKKGKKSAGKRG
jgi:hypothetical protein